MTRRNECYTRCLSVTSHLTRRPLQEMHACLARFRAGCSVSAIRGYVVDVDRRYPPAKVSSREFTSSRRHRLASSSFAFSQEKTPPNWTSAADGKYPATFLNRLLESCCRNVVAASVGASGALPCMHAGCTKGCEAVPPLYLVESHRATSSP